MTKEVTREAKHVVVTVNFMTLDNCLLALMMKVIFKLLVGGQFHFLEKCNKSMQR